MRFAENSIISYLLEWSTSRRLWASIVLVTCWPLFLAAQGPSTVPDAQTTNDETPRPDPQTQAVDADTNPRATFALFQLDDSVWKYFQDGKELQTDEWEPIYQLLHVLTRIDAWQRFRWSQPIPEWRSIDIAPDQSRGLMYQLSGHVRSWQRHDLPAEVAKRFGYDHFYQVEMISSLEQRPIVLCVRSLPTNWHQAKTDGSASEFPVRCDGVFLKTGDADGENEKTSLIFATDHLAWYPSDESTALGVSIGRAMLGANQMDVTLFDTLDPQPRLSDRDQECFYQMLATVRRIALSTPKIDPRPPELSIDTALGSPERLTGDLVRLQGTARRAIRIAIDNVELSTRLGIDHYYEVECVLPLKDSMVDRESGVRYNRFPVTICIPQLPTNLPQGDDIRADIECDAFFLKLWSYRNAFLSQELSASRAVTGTSIEQLGRESSPVRQISPLLIGVSMQVAKPIEPSQNTWSTWTLIGLLLTFLVGILLYRLLTQHGDKQLQSWRNNHDLPNQLGDRLKNS